MALTAEEQAAARAGFSMPEGNHRISNGDDAIRKNAVAAMEFARGAWVRKETPLSDTDNLDAITEGAWVASNDRIATALLLPDAYPGILEAYPVGWAGALQVFTSLRGGVWHRAKVAQVWGTWARSDAPTVQRVRPPSSLDALEPGSYTVTNDKDATALLLPDAYPGILVAYPVGSSGALQVFTSLRGGEWQRAKVQGAWSRWQTRQREDAGAQAPLQRELLQQSLLARKGGRIGTAGKGVIVIRLDDYPTETREVVIPLLKERGLPFTRVSTSERVHEETISDSEFAAMQTYCLDAGGEVWHHGRTHGDATGEEGIQHELIDSLYTLQSKLPRLPVDCFAPPGGGRQFDGYRQGPDAASLYGTYAGQQIMTHHALVSGYFETTYYYHLDGTLKDGFRFYTADTWNYARAVQYIDYAAAWQSGVVLMWHPRFIGTTGNMSLADFTRWLDALVTARDAGKVDVLTMSGMAVADVASSYRRDLLTKHSSTAPFSENIKFPQYRSGVPGSTVVLEATVTGAAGSAITSTVGDSQKTTTIPAGGRLKLYHAATIPKDLAADLRVNISAAVENVHLYAA